ncbi:hypothetical protein HPB50_004315 [Hyalomma asiaticum]|uniref:Uncharacterized protein n=1 Tax=Hyalomma asiaticum TaxID=266040 RepID=A0ACB7RLW7_HYAAI|nr:hypothetical protein HPB50_004315 [Hyalomma asiaticum]
MTADKGSGQGGLANQKRTLFSKRCTRLACGTFVLVVALVTSALMYLRTHSAPHGEASATKARGRHRMQYDREDGYGGYTTTIDFADRPPRSVDSPGTVGRPCTTSGCLWLDSHLSPRSAERGDPCDDFYKHACAGLGNSVNSDGRARLMAAVKDVLLLPTSLRTSDGDVRGRTVSLEPEVHEVVLKRCLSGGPPVLFADDINSECEESPEPHCPSRLPEALAKASEKFFRGRANATVSTYADFVESGASTRGHQDDDPEEDPGSPGGNSTSPDFSKEWVGRACKWVSSAARCHLRVNLRRPRDNASAYQHVWKAMYFAPFMGQKGDRLLGMAYSGSTSPRQEACMTIMADVFQEETLAAAKRVLSKAVHNLHASLAEVVRGAWQMIPALPQLSNGGSGNSSDEQAYDAQGEFFQDEDHQINVAIMDSHYKAVGGGMAPFSAETRLVRAKGRPLIIVSPGVLGVMVNASSSIEPVLVPALSRPVLRGLVEAQTDDADSEDGAGWRLNDVAQCLASRMNVSTGLSREVALESVVLGPLFRLYWNKLEKTRGRTPLHAGYTNEELFFVLWAQLHCGETDVGALVNAAARNSVHWNKAFRCQRHQRMFTDSGCPVKS